MSNTDFGYGQIRIDDGASELQSITAIVRRLVERLDVCKLVKVVAVNAGNGSPPAAGTVDVQLLVNQVDGNFFGVQHGIVHGLQYFRFQAGPWAIVADPAVNDIGFIIVADRDSSGVAKNPSQQINPASRRRYNVADGIYVGGLLNAVPAATIWLKSDGTWVLTDKPGNVLKGDSNGVTMTPIGQGLTVNGPITSTGKITGTDFSDGTVTSYKVHTHSGVTTGAGTSGPPTPGS